MRFVPSLLGSSRPIEGEFPVVGLLLNGAM